MQTIFGPIHSRRFGTSLGIDLSPSIKQCNFDCLYCELAPMAPMQEQQLHVSVEKIISELKEALLEHSAIDVLTITANGEPTMYPYMDALLDAIATLHVDAKTLILSNSALLHVNKVYHTLMRFDKVKLSLDALSEDVFKKIDRPHQSIAIDDITSALKTFSREFNGELYIEILFVHGLNDTEQEVAKLNALLLTLDNITRIDLSSIDRPPAYPVQGISYGELYHIAQMFDSTLPIHIASRQHAESNQSSYSDDEIINTLDKRPLTKEDTLLLFDTASQERLEALLANGEIETKALSGVEFYLPRENLQRKRKKS